MKPASPDRTGVLVVRLWTETEHEAPLRARITQSLDTVAIEQSVAVAASVDAICDAVKQWVEAFAGADTADGDDR